MTVNNAGKISLYIYVLSGLSDTKAICKNLSRDFLLELGFLLSDHTSSEEIFFYL